MRAAIDRGRRADNIAAAMNRALILALLPFAALAPVAPARAQAPAPAATEGPAPFRIVNRTGGELRLAGERLNGLATEEIARRGVAHVSSSSGGA